MRDFLDLSTQMNVSIRSLHNGLWRNWRPIMGDAVWWDMADFYDAVDLLGIALLSGDGGLMDPFLRALKEEGFE